MKITAILPHLLHNGGVRRFIELGNEFVKMGHLYEIVVPSKCRRDWDWDFLGNVKEGWAKFETDIAITGDTSDLKCLKLLDDCEAKKKYVYVIVGGGYRAIYKQYYKKYPFILNNRIFLKDYTENCYLVEGGITKFWKPKGKIKVGFQGRKDFGITEALGDLDNVELVPFKGLNDEQLRDAYRKVDYFVIWEQRAGWGNTAAEALACGTSVITNGINTEPFQDRCIKVKDLRKFFEPMQDKFSYEANAKKLIKVFESHEK